MRRIGWALTTAILAAGGALAAAPPGLASVPTATPAAVAAGLGVKGVPGELVILVDISGSMSASKHGLYPQVQQELPRFMNALAKQDPQDTVGVVVFGAAADTQTIYVGPPAGYVPLPGDATSPETDFGAAFKQAVGILREAPSNVQAGGVLLMSDGQLDAPGDPEYDGYQAPGWRALRTQIASLPMPVTGYGLPLISDQTDIDGVNEALAAVFSHRQLLTRYVGDLGAELMLADQQIYDSKIADAARSDIGRGVRVTWSGLPGTSGGPPLSLASGQCTVLLTLTSTTQRVPLAVGDLSVTSSGLPVTMSGTLSASDRTLAPGKSITLPVHLRWHSMPEGSSLAGSQRTLRGRLQLSGNVYSPYTHAIRDAYGDTAFSVGGLAGGTSSAFSVTAPTGVNLILWVLFLLAVVIVLITIGAMRARLDGSLILTSVDGDPRTLPLPRLPRATTRTDDLIAIDGWLTVRGTPFGKTMQITLRLDNRPAGRGILRPGGRTMIAGIDVVHLEPGSVRPRAARRWS